MRSGAALERAVAATTEKLGAPDIVVHAAAASFAGGVFDTDPETFLDLYDVNVVGAVRLLQLCVPAMRSRGGSVILFSSINADFATPTLAAYAATKAAINNLVMTAALELAPDKIRVNAIAPASIDTPLLRSSFARTADPETAVARTPRDIRSVGSAPPRKSPTSQCSRFGPRALDHGIGLRHRRRCRCHAPLTERSSASMGQHELSRFLIGPTALPSTITIAPAGIVTLDRQGMAATMDQLATLPDRGPVYAPA